MSQPKLLDTPLYALLHKDDITGFNSERPKDGPIDMVGGDFRGLDMRELNADGVDFRDAYFRSADLRGIELPKSLLEGVSFRRCDLDGANLSGARLARAILKNASFREAYLAIADEAKKQGLPFAGHVPESVSAAEASDLGQKSIDHLTGVELACSDKEDELRREAVAALAKVDNQAAWDLLGRIGVRAADSFTEKKARALYARFVRNGTWQVPTLNVLRSLVSLDDPKFTADGRVKYMPPSFRSWWSMKLPPETAAGLKRWYRRCTWQVRAMHQAGVPFLAGTDTSNPYIFPGFSLHDELALIVAEGGFTPDDIKEILLQQAIYCGVPAANHAVKEASAIIAELRL